MTSGADRSSRMRFPLDVVRSTDVVIVDLAKGGKTYTPAEFARLYKDAKR